jgi:hypothetical protein
VIGKGASVPSGVMSGEVDRLPSRWTRACGVVAVALCAVALGGCATRPATQSNAKYIKYTKPVAKASISRSEIPLPDRTLLQRQAEPDCGFRGTVSSPMTAEEVLQKLDYEQQCYRQAEEIVRTRLRQLQDSIGITIRVIEQRKHSVR